MSDEQPLPEQPDPLIAEAQSIAARLHDEGTPEHDELWPVEWARLLEKQAQVAELKSRFRASGRYGL